MVRGFRSKAALLSHEMTQTGIVPHAANKRRTERGSVWPERRRRGWAGFFVVAWVIVGAIGCGAPGRGAPGSAATPNLNDVDTSSLTTRERQQWTDLVSELAAPCPDHAMTLARCVDTKAPCRACLPAARMLVDFLERGSTNNQAIAAYRIRFSPDEVRAIALEGSPARGASSPIVIIVDWADFECPYCAATAHALHALVDKYPDRVRVVFKHYPLSSHPNSHEAARAAVAAHLQGKFWPMHDRLYASQQTGINTENIHRIAREVGLDEAVFVRDCKSARVESLVLRDQRQADRLALPGTPFLYINGRHFDLALFAVDHDLESWVQQEFELAGSSPVSIAPAASTRAPQASTLPAGGRSTRTRLSAPAEPTLSPGSRSRRLVASAATTALDTPRGASSDERNGAPQ